MIIPKGGGEKTGILVSSYLEEKGVVIFLCLKKKS